jgi:chromosomal replication initiator protein
MQAIRQMAKTSGYHVLYVSTEKLTNDFIAAIRNGEAETFRSKYIGVDFLLVDDFHFLSGKTQTQECFSHIFNDCYDADCQIVLTCDCPPKAISSINKKLRSRLEWGLVVGIESPDLETRLSILAVKSQQLKLKIPDETMNFISSCFPHNIRELEGGFNRVVTYAKLSGAPVNMDIARQALADLVPCDKEKDVTLSPHHIVEIVASYYNLETDALKSKKRDRNTALARQVAMYLLREQNNLPLNKIGNILGNRDHSTVLYGCDKISTEMQNNAQLKKAIETLIDSLSHK